MYWLIKEKKYGVVPANEFADETRTYISDNITKLRSFSKMFNFLTINFVLNTLILNVKNSQINKSHSLPM